jgi:DNA-binding transcriptional LysR family regulator
VTNLSRIDLNLLVVLETIVVEGGVSRAAERLNLTQPAVSHALARLRDLFGDPLFVRQGRTLAPTALTKRLIEPLHQSLHALGALIGKSDGFDPARSETTFAVAMRDPMEVLILPTLMRRLARDAAKIDLRTVQVRRRSVETGLADGTLDAVLDVALPLSERIHRQRVGADRFVVVARKAHPRVRPGFTLPTYLEQRHVMVTSRRRGPGAEDIELGQHGLRRHVSLRCRNFIAAFRVVGATDLVLTMPERYAALLAAGSAVRVLRMPLKMPTLDLYLYWHDRVHDDPANRWLRERLVEALGGYQASRLARRMSGRPGPLTSGSRPTTR